MQLLERIQGFLECTGMSQSRFGRLAMNDPRFVGDLLNGRRLNHHTVDRIERWLVNQEQAR